MTVLSAAISTKSKILVSRQFQNISKCDLDSLTIPFYNLIERERSDHTYIETDKVRYVYQPLDSIYIFLITNINSNIIEDLEIIKVLSQIIQDICQGNINESTILKKCFTIIFYIDELIKNGVREIVNTNQIKTYIEMESHEEKLQTIIRENKEKEEKERRKFIASKLEKNRQKQNKGSTNSFISNDIISALEYNTSIIDNFIYKNEEPDIMDESFGTHKGMQLANKRDNHIRILDVVENNKIETKPTINVNSLFDKSINIIITENIICTLSSEGTLCDLDIQGIFNLQINNHKYSKVIVELENEYLDKAKIHPILDKNKYNSNVLELKDKGKNFRTNTIYPLLKWKINYLNDSYIPLNISCWPCEDSESTLLNLEIENKMKNIDEVIYDLNVNLMCPSSNKPQIISKDKGVIEHDGLLLSWKVGTLKNNQNCQIEISIQSKPESVFPFSVEAKSNMLSHKLNVLKVYDEDTKEDVEYEVKKNITYLFTINK
ncbi:coatomer subunit delta [Plasmodium brasilianum]|uniref:Coatomer subunit delta n=2 Tax=Plasmodium (Plasmodium) TaxID=418103 RepID=A0A1A8W3P1_PLAMA|nr:coatomer subunit delta, putative [Plasmodium malariae]KAI4838467.1 coatomer subunit delta [Plasmodium brasilianum]SBS85766.1 coatomer subunit delta, putative [Plasmodium malariae]SCN12865.1 coatomer subunit delta, putative [Plasmodium malariae]